MAATFIYRTFRNMDRRDLCRVWNQSWYAKNKGGLIRVDQFEGLLLSQMYFDPAQLVVAVEPFEKPDPNGLFDGQIVGFAHGGFAPNKELNGCDKSAGYVAMLVTEEREDQQEIRAGLLHKMEEIFFRMGIRTVFVGAVYPNAPFYAKEAFGGDPNGIAENDPFLPQVLLRNQYIAVERYRTLMFTLHTIIPLSFPQRMLVSKVDLVTPDDYSIQTAQAPAYASAANGFLPVPQIPRDWWGICADPDMEWNHFILMERNTHDLIAWVGIRDLTPGKGEGKLLGLHHLFVKPEFRNRGYAKLLVKQVLNKLQLKYPGCHVRLVLPESNPIAIRTFDGLPFETISTGNVYRRELPVDFSETFQTDRKSEIGTDLYA